MKFIIPLSNNMQIEIKKGNLLEQNVEVIVNPANATGYMGNGVAKAIASKGGKIIEDQAVAGAPILIGEPVITTSGVLPFKAVVHTATIDDINNKIEKGTISKALIGALYVIDEAGYQSVAIPGMATGLGGTNIDIAAEAMIEAIKVFKSINIKQLILVDLNEDIVEAWKKYLKK